MAAKETWKSTVLRTELEKREGDAAAATILLLDNILPEVETTLAKGDSTPSGFTLHDEEHSQRVAEMIARIAGEGLLGQMSPYELGLLLLSAYLHDIGMTPPVGKVRAHFAYMLTGDAGDLGDDQVDALQVFLDDNWEARTPPLCSQTPTNEEVALAGRIVAAYIREQHNDWGTEWIRAELAGHAKDLYAGWLEDLILLCRSHHYGIEQLRHADFNPKRIGSSGEIVHLRFCACLLRVADVLDFDPERTPPVLFAHRDVKDGSIIFWHKDHEIGFSLDEETITIDARPSDAVTHHAVECTIKDVERELVLCDQLGEETQFQRLIGRKKDLPHQWPLGTRVQRQIIPRGNYVYVDGTFRPDPRRVLDLIGGVELYGDDLVAVRELLQNAFDAVREQIARERLAQPQPKKEETFLRLATTHSVTLRLEQEDGQLRLVCSDSGGGMSKDVLLNRFLVGGKSANHEIRDLERRCEAAGFSMGRTARFGIGALSYFLLASRLAIETRRSILAGGAEGIGWTFSSAGLEDFGELSPNATCNQGTVVTFTLKDDIASAGYDAFARRLRDYLVYLLRRIPCRFRFEAEGAGVEPLELEPGWTATEAAVEEEVVDSTERLEENYGDSMPIEMLPSKRREERSEKDAFWAKVRKGVADTLEISHEEGLLPQGLGSYRIFTVNFRFGDDLSIGYLELEDEGEDHLFLRTLGRQDVFGAPSIVFTSWNGMEVDSRYGAEKPLERRMEAMNSIIEVDWTNDAAGRLAVSRNEVQLSEAGTEALEFVVKKARKRLRQVAEEAPKSRFGLMNARMTGADGDDIPDPRWILEATQGSRKPFGRIEFPVRDSGMFGLDNSREALGLQGQRVALISALTVGGGISHRSVTWHGIEVQPGMIGVIESRKKPVVIWTGHKPVERHLGAGLVVKGVFPPGWDEVIGYNEVAVLVLNGDHPLIDAIDAESWEWVQQRAAMDDPLEFRDELFGSRARLAAWIAKAALRSSRDLWNGVVDRDPDFFRSAWKQIGLQEEDRLVYLDTRRIQTLEMRKLSPGSFDLLSQKKTVTWVAETMENLPPDHLLSTRT